MNRLLRQYVRWHLRDADELKELLAELQQAQQAAAEAQEALLTVNGALLAAKQREEQQQGDLQAAVELHRQGTTDCEALLRCPPFTGSHHFV